MRTIKFSEEKVNLCNGNESVSFYSKEFFLNFFLDQLNNFATD